MKMKCLYRLASVLAIALTVVLLTACGGGGSDKKEPTQEPVKTKAPTKESTKSDLDQLAQAVVMVAPGVFDDEEFVPVASGSGTIVDKDGLILTNYHVVDPMGVGAYEAIAIYVTEDPKEDPQLTYFGGLAAWDEDMDLAVIRITENRRGIEIDPNDLELEVVSLGDPDNLDIGDALTVLGYPAIGEGSLELTKGTVSGFLSSEGREQSWIKTDARIAAGNSGGGAFDEAGKLVGVPTAIYYVEALGNEVSGRLRPIDMASRLLKEARATKEVVIPQIEEQGTVPGDFDVPMISLTDFPDGYVATEDSFVTNEDRAIAYEDVEEALAFYEENGRIGGVRRVFDDFDSADALSITPTVIMVQVDLYETAAGAASAAGDECSEYLDTTWEFLNIVGLEFYEPEFVSDPGIGEESCLLTAEEVVETVGEPPVLLSVVGFRQGEALVVIGVMTLDVVPVDEATYLAEYQRGLLTGGGFVGSGQPRPTGGGPTGYATAEDAIGHNLNAFGQAYAGNCAAVAAGSVGAYCSMLIEDKGSQRIYLAGLFASEADTWFLAGQYPDGSWKVIDSAPVTYDSGGDIEEPAW